jgi:hypothetical protein
VSPVLVVEVLETRSGRRSGGAVVLSDIQPEIAAKKGTAGCSSRSSLMNEVPRAGVLC